MECIFITSTHVCIKIARTEVTLNTVYLKVLYLPPWKNRLTFRGHDIYIYHDLYY